MPIYDVQQMDSEFEKATNDLENVDDVPVLGRVTYNGVEMLLDLLGIEYDPDENVLYLNMGARR